MRRRGTLAVAGVVVLAGGGIGARALLGGAAASPAPAVTTVDSGELVATVSATGNLQPLQQFTLDFTSAGRLAEVDVKPGDRVAKGQVLARIDDGPAQDDVATATANLAAAGPAEAAVVAATEKLHEAQRALADTALTARSDGVVTAVAGHAGELVAAGPSTTGFITLSDTSALPVHVGFSEADSARIKVGQSAQITFDALPGRTVDGTVSAVLTTPTVVNNVVTYPVTITFPLFDGARAGMTANVVVTVEKRQAPMVIPNAAIAAVGDVTEVVVVDAGRQTYRPVKLGLQADTTTEVLSGLSPGERILADKPVAHEADGDVIPPPLPKAGG